MDAVAAAKPSGAKGTYIRSVHLAATMSPGIRLDPSAAQSLRAA
jgi:large subunit ribosomal protein L1